MLSIRLNRSWLPAQPAMLQVGSSRDLLAAGVHVHAAVRDPSNEGKIAHLNAMAKESEGDITFFKADLLEDGSFADAMAGCSIVFHTASPFIVKYDDPQRDLIDPAVNGTKNVLEQANKTDSVKRVVLTSSCAAIFGEVADIAKAPNGILTEEIWNTSSSLDNSPYSYSKTQAEKAAWDVAEAQDRWTLVVINPALVLGPGTAERQTSASFDYVRMLGDGTFKDGAPMFQIGCVDVRDVADAHVRAAYTEAAEGRHITSGPGFTLGDMADHLRDEFGADYPLPAPVEFEGPFWNADNSKIQKELGVSFRDVMPGLRDMFVQLIEDGQIPKA